MEMPEGFKRYEKQINDWISSHKDVEKPLAGMAAQNVLGLLRLIKEMAEELDDYDTGNRASDICMSETLKKFKEWK